MSVLSWGAFNLGMRASDNNAARNIMCIRHRHIVGLNRWTGSTPQGLLSLNLRSFERGIRKHPESVANPTRFSISISILAIILIKFIAWNLCAAVAAANDGDDAKNKSFET